ncbi:ISSd1, transposase OrfB [Escherichia coli]|uniref:ISSd1, transposase OrfB n=1 Tax=Escherichia coli TaxID=562 RepID=A0A376P985_ECOLX|nr:ISSd1, transposase OrfB [Escherichia coli]
MYLAGIKDVYTCEIVGYAMGERMTKELTGKALFMALRSQRPPAGLIHHSDRGSQYCAYDYRVIQEQFGLKTSMSRKGNCYDNAPMESFWGTLKNESLSHYRFNNRDEAISVIREYIEIFYNRQASSLSSGEYLPGRPSGKNIIRWLLKKRTNGSVPLLPVHLKQRQRLNQLILTGQHTLFICRQLFPVQVADALLQGQKLFMRFSHSFQWQCLLTVWQQAICPSTCACC